MHFFQETSEGILLKVILQPRSSQNQVVGMHGDALKLKITAPPVDGAANKLCIQFLAKCLRIPRASVEIIAGRKSRRKTVKLRSAEQKQTKELIKKLQQLSK